MEEGSINFKALRAKFQEEALLAQSRTSRPAVAEKPKHLLTPGGHCSSVANSVNNAGESKTPAGSHVLYRDRLRASGGRRPISFQPQPQQTSPLYSSTGENTKMLSLRERAMPLVLPALPVNDQKREPPTKEEHKQEPEKEVLPQTKIKKKGLLLPFKSAKTSKVSEESGVVPTHVDLTTRPWSAATELPSVEKQNAEDGVSFYSDQSTSECPCSSPDITVTPPPAETSMEVDSRVLSTLEWAKKKFSYRQIISTIPKTLRSPGSSPRDEDFPSPPKNIDCGLAGLPIPPPVCVPHLACISARPFSKANLSTRKVALDTQRDKVENLSSTTAKSPAPCVPQKKLLPDQMTLGLPPQKPTRPPAVNLSDYYPPYTSPVSSCCSQVPTDEKEPEQPSIPRPVLDFPKFPDFEIETEERETVDIATLDLEVLDLVSTDIPAPVDEGSSNIEGQQSDLSAFNPAEASGSYVTQDLNLGSPNIIPLHPASFPEPINLSEFPGPWSQSKEALEDSFPKSHCDETDLVAAECLSVPEETELSSHTTWSDGNQTQSSMHQQEGCCGTYDNIYEEVENVSKYILDKNVCQRQVNLKNPYMAHNTMEDPTLTKWQHNQWVGVPLERTHLVHNHVLSREHQHPSSADYKEQKKREKQRLEKERKEQKEREKKENEMRKKFKVTGEEEPMYDAMVMVDSKIRKHDLPVKSGDTVSIIRITNCPKGKWLARDANHKYGYISVMNVVLNMKEMREFGKKAQAAGRGGNMEGDNISIGSRSSSHRVLTSSFTDDSEEWACEDETMSPPSSESYSFAQMSGSAPGMSGIHVGAQHTLSDASLEDLNTHTRHEALQKLAIFFQHKRNEFGDIPEADGATPTNDDPPSFLQAVEEPPYPEQEVDFTDLEFLPPPPLYADTA